MKQKVLEKIRDKLVEKQNDILETFAREETDEIADSESENVIGDIVDEANNVYQMLISSKLNEKEKEKLHEIEEALKRIEESVYGRCVKCGREIEEKRLLAIPEAKKCIVCKSAEERRRL